MSDSRPARAIDPRHARYSLGLLVFLYVINYVDRQVLSVLIEPIKRDLGASDTQMGILSGIAFALFYTTMGVPIARLADRGVRRTVIVWGVVVWSAMTALCGAAQSFIQLSLARFGVGVGEAALNPPAHSLIADYFPPERRATALAIFNVGGNLGVMLGFFAGGWLGETFGWREAFLVVGLPGLAAALLARWTLLEPPRGTWERAHAVSAAHSAARSSAHSTTHRAALPADQATDPAAAPEAPSFPEVVRFLASKPTFVYVSLASAFYVFAAYGCTIWAPTFLIRVHHLSLSEVGLWVGLIQGIGGGLGTFVGGVLGDRLGAREPRMRAWIPALGGLLAIPLLLVFLFAPTSTLALAGYAPAMAASVLFVGPTYALVQELAPVSMRAQAAAILLFTMNLIGLGIAPVVVGALNDGLASRFGDEAVRYSLLVSAATSAIAVGFSALAARAIRRDREATLG